MDTATLDLARLEFAVTASIHFLFVAFTLGVATLVALVQTRATVTGSPLHWRMTRYWGQLYVINYAVGIVTGLVMELQLGLNWSGLGHFSGNVFGSLLAMETLTAFFLESTFLGLWIFGWGRMNRWLHLGLIWGIVLTAYASAFWIMLSNGFLQNPVGSRVVDGVLRLTDASAVFTNASALVALGHLMGGALLTGGLVFAGVSAWQLRGARHGDEVVYATSLKWGLRVALPALPVTAWMGVTHFDVLEATQPMKSALLGDSAEQALLQGQLAAQYGPDQYVPSSIGTIAAYLMMFCWVLMLLVTLVGLAGRRVRLRLLTLALPLPFIALLAGWVFRETGRQPWVVYGLLKTGDALSPMSPLALRTSLVVFTGLFVFLGVVNYWLLARFARRGPDGSALGVTSADPAASIPHPTF